MTNLNEKVANLVRRTNKKNRFDISNSCRRIGKIKLGLDYVKDFEGESIRDDVKVLTWKYIPLKEEYELYCISPYFEESYPEILEYAI